MRPPPSSDGVLMSAGSSSPCSSGGGPEGRRLSSELTTLPAANQRQVEKSRNPPVDEAYGLASTTASSSQPTAAPTAPEATNRVYPGEARSALRRTSMTNPIASPSASAFALYGGRLPRLR